jgi:hypothetical protein
LKDLDEKEEKTMKINFKIKLVICMLIPVVILLSMTVTPLLTLYNGTEIYIKSNAYNSSDSFRGKNLSIEYSINHLDISKFPQSLLAEQYKNNNVINAYAVLKKNGEFYEVDYITLKKPTSNLYLKCFFSPYYPTNPNEGTNSKVYVNYNLDKYFLSEKQGLILSQQPKYENEITWNYSAKLKIYKGYALLTDVILKK